MNYRIKITRMLNGMPHESYVRDPRDARLESGSRYDRYAAIGLAEQYWSMEAHRDTGLVAVELVPCT